MFKSKSWEIPRTGVIFLETIYPHELFSQCSKHGSDCVFSTFMIKYFIDDPHFPIEKPPFLTQNLSQLESNDWQLFLLESKFLI